MFLPNTPFRPHSNFLVKYGHRKTGLGIPNTPINACYKNSIGKLFSNSISTFLVIDNDSSIDTLLTPYFSQNNCECFYIRDSIQAESWLNTNDCQAIIMDINLAGSKELTEPLILASGINDNGLSGPEVRRVIRGLVLVSRIRESHPYLPIIVFTRYGYIEAIMSAALDLGVNGYVSKSQGVSLLFSTVTRYCTMQKKMGYPGRN